MIRSDFCARGTTIKRWRSDGHQWRAASQAHSGHAKQPATAYGFKQVGDRAREKAHSDSWQEPHRRCGSTWRLVKVQVQQFERLAARAQVGFHGCWFSSSQEEMVVFGSCVGQTWEQDQKERLHVMVAMWNDLLQSVVGKNSKQQWEKEKIIEGFKMQSKDEIDRSVDRTIRVGFRRSRGAYVFQRSGRNVDAGREYSNVCRGFCTNRRGIDTDHRDRVKVRVVMGESWHGEIVAEIGGSIMSEIIKSRAMNLININTTTDLQSMTDGRKTMTVYWREV